jgi:hypothetical protein
VGNVVALGDGTGGGSFLVTGVLVQRICYARLFSRFG